MRGNQQSYRSLFRIFMLAGFLASLAALFAAGTLAQEAVPPTARQAAAMPKYASRLAHAKTVPLHSSALQGAGLNRRRGSPQDQVIYDNGPTTGTADAWTINWGFAATDSLSLSSSSQAEAAAFIFWLSPGDTTPTVDLSIGTSPFGNDVASFTGLVSTGSTNLGSNQYGFNLEQDSYSFSGVNLNAGTTYWVTLQNANVPSGDPVYWDENSGPSMAQESTLGTIPSESFSILGGTTTSTEPPPCFNEQPQNGFQVIHDFSGGADGRYQGGITIDQHANLYGKDCTTDECSWENLYKLSENGQNWTLTPLEGLAPYQGNEVGPGGVLYGTSFGNPGNVFNLTPEPTACTTALCSWTESLLYNFTGYPDASIPSGALTFDARGNIYGTSRTGGGGACYQGSGCGTVYELAPSGAGWTEKVLYKWQGVGAGAEPSGILFGIDGNLYGRTDNDGEYRSGTVYQLVPSGGGWTKTILYSFHSQQDDYGDGIAPRSLVQDNAGNLYGIARESGYPFPHGIVYMLSPANGNWTFTILRDNADSGDLLNNLAIDSAGNLHGTGGLGRDFGCGLIGWCFGYIFKLTHENDGWQYSTPIYFNHQRFQAEGAVALDAEGNLYGTTLTCGRYGYGTVWKLSP